MGRVKVRREFFPRAPRLATFLMLMAALAFAVPAVASAQDNPFTGGWTLQSDASSLNFQSVKNVTKDGQTATKVESNRFATFSGLIDGQGMARLKVLLDSIDTKVDLRNVRMRFLLFETFKFPEATITARIDPAQLADLAQVRRKTVHMPYSLTLHGQTRSYETDVVVTLLSDDLVVISTSTPIPVPTADFDLTAGVLKLEEAANVQIIPSGSVTFDLTFKRNGTAGQPAPVTATAGTQAPAADASAALESKGNFDLAECKGRFEILSRAGNIFFASGSARLDAASHALLDSLGDIVRRCPGLTIEVSGHTDSDGGTRANQRLSEARARSVALYLVSKGIEAARIRSIGYGETRPVVPNDSAAHKARNRRIEFAVVDG